MIVLFCFILPACLCLFSCAGEILETGSIRHGSRSWETFRGCELDENKYPTFPIDAWDDDIPDSHLGIYGEIEIEF